VLELPLLGQFDIRPHRAAFAQRSIARVGGSVAKKYAKSVWKTHLLPSFSYRQMRSRRPPTEESTAARRARDGGLIAHHPRRSVVT